MDRKFLLFNGISVENQTKRNVFKYFYFVHDFSKSHINRLNKTNDKHKSTNVLIDKIVQLKCEIEFVSRYQGEGYQFEISVGIANISIISSINSRMCVINLIYFVLQSFLFLFFLLFEIGKAHSGR